MHIIINETKTNTMKTLTATYTYNTTKGTNVETFTSTGYITLIQNGLFKYEHHFGSHMLNLQEQMLVKELIENNISYEKTIS